MSVTSRLDADTSARLLAWARVALGAVAYVAPAVPARPWIGADASRASARTLGRALGIRDIALGLGTVVSQRRGAPVRGWLEAAALSVTGDVVATLIGWRSRPARGRLAVLAAAATGAAACSYLARRVSA